MAFDRFLIAPMSESIRTDLKPWLIPDEAFQEMNNAYTWRGRIKKRPGGRYTGNGWTVPETAQLFSRLGINLHNITPVALAGGAGVGITSGVGAATGTVPNLVYKIGQKFSIAGVMFTVTTAGAAQPMVRTPVGGTIHTYGTTNGVYNFTGEAINTQIYFYPMGNFGTGQTDGAGLVDGYIPGNIKKIGQMFSIGDTMFTIYDITPGHTTMYRTDGLADPAWFDSATGQYHIENADKVTDVYFYPGEPVMMLDQYQLGPINDQRTLACDTQFVYFYNGNFWDNFDIAVFHGTNSDFFWGCNFVPRLTTTGIPTFYLTNFNAIKNGAPAITDDPIWYYDGVTWSVFRPYFLPGAGGVIAADLLLVIMVALFFSIRLNTIQQPALMFNIKVERAGHF